MPMSEQTSLAPYERILLLDFIRSARVATEFTKSDFAYIAVGNKDRQSLMYQVCIHG